ncbi:MAG: class I/II aminotransferase [Deltaproteobacteria bacterium]|nr:class I/II aminotransferase [Deltaproteobacteria bacterium]
MSPYAPPQYARDPARQQLMEFNEVPLVPPESVAERLMEFARSDQLNLYPQYGPLLNKLSDYTGAAPESLLLTNGSDQGIELILRAFLDPGDHCVLTKPGFAMFQQVANAIGAEVRGPTFPLEDFRFPFDEFVASVQPDTKLIIIINPNNPTGSSVTQEQIQEITRHFPEQPILVDEAYYEFTGETCAGLLRELPNLIILRTFSKAFALPSLRIGYVTADPEFILELRKIQGPFDVNMMATVAAEQVLDEQEEMQRQVRHLMDESKPALEAYFQERGVRYFPSKAHFMLVASDRTPELVDHLHRNNMMVRPQGPPIDHTFRMSVRTLPEMQQFMEVFDRFLNR